MEISVRRIGTLIVEMTIKDGGTTLITDIANTNGEVSEGLISNMREVAEDLESWNNLIKIPTSSPAHKG